MKEFERLSHAYIITNTQTAFDLAMTAVCSADDSGGVRPCLKCKDCYKASKHIHPDIISVSKRSDKREIIIEQIREIKKDVYIAPNEAMRKVYIINNADIMNVNAQNAFLQMLEEPPPHAVFILVADNPAALLPTVRSRCVRHNFHNITAETGSADIAELSEAAASLALDYVAAIGDNMLLTECMFSLDKLDRDTFAEFIALARAELVRALRADPGNRKAAEADELLVSALDMMSLNVSVGHISGFLCAPLLNLAQSE